jgi:hypothetical protein
VQLGLRVAVPCGAMAVSASGAMSGWRSQKVVMVVCAGHGGVVGCRGGSPENLLVLRTLISCHMGDKVVLAQFSWALSSTATLECPVYDPLIIVTTSSLRHGWEIG